MSTNQVLVEAGPDSTGKWRVHVRKGPGVANSWEHPELLPQEAEALAKELLNAANAVRRHNSSLVKPFWR